MKPKDFLDRLDDAAVIAEIAAAERKSSGEIRVYVSKKAIHDPVERATVRFKKLGMDKTRDRNGVLLYFAPLTQKYAVIGDAGIHEKCGQSFWEEVAAEIRTQLKEQHFTEAVVRAVRKVGEVLARHFPRSHGDRDELPNAILRDEEHG